MEIGNHALKTGNYHALAVEWLELSKSLIGSKLADAQIDPIQLDELILEAVETV